MNEILLFIAVLLCVEVSVFLGMIASEYMLFVCGRKDTLFNETRKTLLKWALKRLFYFERVEIIDKMQRYG